MFNRTIHTTKTFVSGLSYFNRSDATFNSTDCENFINLADNK